jgi:hypothetical protein
MLITVFVCIGFMLAVLYIDLMFDVTAVPYRRTGAALPKEVLAPITHYYGRITQNPYVLMFVMLTATVCLVAEIVYDLVPRWAAYSSLFFMGLAMVAGSLKVIPTAQRLGSDKDPADVQTSLIHHMLPSHLVLLVSILLLAVIQLMAAGRANP